MFTDMTKKYREPVSYALVAVAGLYLIAGLSLLFKSGPGFGAKSAAFGWVFTAPIPVLCLVVAVILVTRLGDLTPTARLVVLAALGIVAVDALFAVIAFFAQFGADDGFSSGFANFGGVVGAGKIVGMVLGLAHLAFLGAAGFFVFTAFQGLPAITPTRSAQQWGAPGQGFGQSGGQYGASSGQPGGMAGGQPGGQQSWGQQPDPSHGAAGSGGWEQGGWGQGGWPPPAGGEQAGWGQPPTQGGQQGGWPRPAQDPAAGRQSWGQPPAVWDQAAAGWQQPAPPPQPAARRWEGATPHEPAAEATPPAAVPDPAWGQREHGDVPAGEDWSAGERETASFADDRGAHQPEVEPAADFGAYDAGDGASHDDRPQPDRQDDQADQRSDETTGAEPPATQGWWQHPQQ